MPGTIDTTSPSDNPAGDSGRFYADLPGFSEFGEFADFSAYRPLPDDWVVLAGDIRGSTQAIAAGQYKTVNMLGAAVITAVLNACPGVLLPYVFGGDGGAIAVPGSHADAARRALQRLMSHARPVFGLELRAAAVPVARIRRDGFDLRLRRLRLNEHNHLAMFAGGGIAHVDRIMKQGAADDPDLIRPLPDDTAPDLEGLSCRWEPLDATRGRMVALMLLPLDKNNEAVGYQKILAGIRGILGQDMADHAPMSRDTLKFRLSWRGLRLEARALGARGLVRSWLTTAFTGMVQLWSHVTGQRVGPYDAPSYVEQLMVQTDFRKFDDCLRLVLDCSEAQVAALSEWLEAAYRRGDLVYGLHVSQQALMTCLVFDLMAGEHIHFIDAADGGFARAATDFKARLGTLHAQTP